MLNNPQIPIQTANYLCVINASQQLFYYWRLTWVLHNTVQTHWALSYYSQDIFSNTLHTTVCIKQNIEHEVVEVVHTHTHTHTHFGGLSGIARRRYCQQWHMGVFDKYLRSDFQYLEQLNLYDRGLWLSLNWNFSLWLSASICDIHPYLVKVGRTQVNSIPCT